MSIGFSFGRNHKNDAPAGETPAASLINPSEIKYEQLHTLLDGHDKVSYETKRGTILISEHGEGLSLCFAPNSKYANKSFPDYAEIHFALNSDNKGYMWQGYCTSHFKVLVNFCEELITSKKAKEELLNILHPTIKAEILPLNELVVPPLKKAI